MYCPHYWSLYSCADSVQLHGRHIFSQLWLADIGLTLCVTANDRLLFYEMISDMELAIEENRTKLKLSSVFKSTGPWSTQKFCLIKVSPEFKKQCKGMGFLASQSSFSAFLCFWGPHSPSPLHFSKVLRVLLQGKLFEYFKVSCFFFP